MSEAAGILILFGVLTTLILVALFLPFITHALEWYWEKVDEWLNR